MLFMTQVTEKTFHLQRKPALQYALKKHWEKVTGHRLFIEITRVQTLPLNTWLLFSTCECSNHLFFFLRETTWNSFLYKFTCCKTIGIHFSWPSSATSKVYLLLFEIIKNGVKVTILVILKLLLCMVTPTCEKKDIVRSTLLFSYLAHISWK